MQEDEGSPPCEAAAPAALPSQAGGLVSAAEPPQSLAEPPTAPSFFDQAVSKTVPEVPVAAIPAMRFLEARYGRAKSVRELLSHPPRNTYGRWGHTFAALDLGTNNCRLLIARPHQTSFKVLDAYSRTVRLGEGLTTSGRLSPDAMARTIEALKVCASRIERRGVTQFRAVATEACRAAENSREFIALAEAETGLRFDVISTEEEARLAVESCSSLIDRESDDVLVFDIGGGSTELVWLDGRKRQSGGVLPIRAWTSVPYGVVSLTERFGTGDRPGQDPRAIFDAMVETVRSSLRRFAIPDEARAAFADGRAHMVGNSGTVTTIAGVLLGLPRYDRARVDGAWINLSAAAELGRELSARPLMERAAHPCIGTERADLIMPGAAILKAIQSIWPCDRLRVADRGLREGVLLSLMARADRKARQRRSEQKPPPETPPSEE
ncbi:MAG: Ppx/GppA phosphatase family protein [Alphaproteobacteria bacterium]